MTTGNMEVVTVRQRAAALRPMVATDKPTVSRVYLEAGLHHHKKKKIRINHLLNIFCKNVLDL